MPSFAFPAKITDSTLARSAGAEDTCYFCKCRQGGRQPPPALPALTTPPLQGSVIKTQQLQAFPCNVPRKHILGPLGNSRCFKLQALLLPISDDPTKFRKTSARSVAVYNLAHRGLDRRSKSVLPAHDSTGVTCQGFLEKVPHPGDTGGQDPS